MARTTDDEVAGGARQVVRSDRWDQEDWAQMQEAVETVGRTIDQLTDRSWTAPRMVTDTYMGLVQSAPRVLDEDEVAPSYRVNRQVFGALCADDHWARLRSYTVGDALPAALATTQLAGKLDELFERLAPLQEQADEWQDAVDEVAEAEQAAADAGDDGDPTAAADLQERLDQLREQAAAAQEAYEVAADRAAPSIGRAVRAAIGAAADDAEGAQQAAAGWGFTPGALAELDPAERVALAAELNTDRMRQIAALFGAMRNEAWAAREARYDAGPDEVHDVTLSDDLARLLPPEFVALAVDELEDGFYERYATGRLLTYRSRTMVKEARGKILLVEDGSPSMRSYGADVWARALGLVMLQIAHEEGRGFTAVVFGGPNTMAVFDFPTPAEFTPATVLAYARCGVQGGGTDFEGPLRLATDRLLAEFEETGRVAGDVVLATDGEDEVTAGWLAGYDADRARAGFTTWGLQIAGPPSPTMTQVCTRHARIESILDANDVADLFSDLWTTKEAQPA
jgi:uncharacterized protein with von Willebrand factor type A (vWA) domain